MIGNGVFGNGVFGNDVFEGQGCGACRPRRETDSATALTDRKRTAAVVFGVGVVPTLVVATRFNESWKASKKLRIIGSFWRVRDKKSWYDANHGQSKKSLVILSVSIKGFTQDAAGSSR